ncbi:thioredoxin [Desulfuribacillus stibiiarsenatis]|uniref:Thioredoxin n=1 Tax=Desulfuribacillus stibiiarsenatis TaxID=1390249 RepID=A0A1E5L395_9FIRM|nr:peroxiredoxin [Desulfuribacillus stibiiarsenatis]OEH84554.1 thioredoxin [Desulfuribacillus stibiiarsenatis]
MAERLIGKAAPKFTMEAVMANGEFGKVSLDELKGKWVVLFFYPLDFTFVCPTEIRGFNDYYEKFQELNCEVIGASTDSKFSHKAWIENGLGALKFPLAQDLTHAVSSDYGVLIEEEGITLRGLFIIDPDGVLKYGVVQDNNVGRSVDETIRVLEAFQSGGLCPINWKPGQATL